jgi:hypothetical protein
MNLLLLLMLSTVPDYCAWQEPREQWPLLKPDDRAMATNSIEIHRNYSAVWARCALDRGGKEPVLRVTADDGQGRHVLVEKTVKMHPSLDPESKPFIYETFQTCDAPTNKRDKGAVLSGPVGRRRWHNPRKITVELLAEGPMAPIGFKTGLEVLCQACVTERQTASMSHYVHEHQKNEARFYISVPKDRYACAEGGGRMIVRRYWADKGSEEWTLLIPYEATDNFQSKLRRKDDTMFYESLEPGARFCKEGKVNVWEVIGLDEYSTIVNHSGHGPSSHIRRDTIEFLKCK